MVTKEDVLEMARDAGRACVHCGVAEQVTTQLEFLKEPATSVGVPFEDVLEAGRWAVEETTALHAKFGITGW